MVAQQDMRGELKLDESLAKHTSWRVGGVADRLYKPADVDDLAEFVATLPEEEPIYWIGLGSNLLIRDGGVRGTVILTQNVLGELQNEQDGRVYAGAGVSCAKLAKQCVRWGLEGADFFAGIPGTVGGALAMNAGAFGGETWEWVEAVEVMDRDGKRRRRAVSDYQIGYRSVNGPGEEWFIGGHFKFSKSREKTRAEIRDLLAKRNQSQPIGLPSCGSVFRNPPGEHAARLIEAAGLKGFRIGGAYVSDKHANFIINGGDASAADIEELITHVRDTVKRIHGVELIPEVRIIGERSK
ncbi:MAG: UDP-N-acetylmuramate dehydrogenase [Gammaproteobacteria bacterium]|nr:UDP-N-acetylmuramate dehydrogenase [Gammaproteobacteria bacterium]